MLLWHRRGTDSLTAQRGITELSTSVLKHLTLSVGMISMKEEIEFLPECEKNLT